MQMSKCCCFITSNVLKNSNVIIKFTWLEINCFEEDVERQIDGTHFICVEKIMYRCFWIKMCWHLYEFYLKFHQNWSIIKFNNILKYTNMISESARGWMYLELAILGERSVVLNPANCNQLFGINKKKINFH